MNNMEDRELETWREQWRAAPSVGGAQLQAQAQKKIQRENAGFILSNLLAAVAAVAAIVIAFFAVRQEPSALRITWAAGVVVMVLVGLSYRVHVQRGAWRAETQSTRAFVELCQRRLRGRLRMIRAGVYLISLWMVFCAVLFAANWPRFGPDIHTHPRDWQWTIVAIAMMVAGSFLFLGWYRRKKIRELDEIKRLLQEMNAQSDT